MATVTIDSGGFKSSKGKTGGALDRVIGEWQKIARSQFQDSAELLLPIIAEIDETRLWETYWDGMFKTRDEFLAKKVLIDFDFVESALPEILDRLKRGETVKLSRKERIAESKRLTENMSLRQAAKVLGVDHTTIMEDLKVVENVYNTTTKRNPNARTLNLSKDAKRAANQIRDKFGDEFADNLKAML